MAEETRLLVIEGEPRIEEEGRLARGIERKRVLSVIREAGARVQHDSGGRLLVVEGSAGAFRKLERALPEAELLPLEEGIDERLGGMDPQDATFARALAIRVSPRYRELKRRQKPGETPEERLLVSGPCTPPEG